MKVQHETPLSMLKEKMQAKPAATATSPNVIYSVAGISFVNHKAILQIAPLLTMPVEAGISAEQIAMAMTRAGSYAPESMLQTTARRVFNQETKAKVHSAAWNAVNFMTVSVATCASVVSVQSPAKTMLATLNKESKLIPTYSGGLLGLARVLYKGTTSAVTGSALRSTYVNGAKDVKPVEETHNSHAGYVIAIAAGELVVKQVPESLSTLQKANVVPEKFNWKTPNNFYQLMSGGFAPKLVSGVINMGCLCLMSESAGKKLVKELPFLNEKCAAAIGGAGSGVIAALAAFPFAQFSEYTLVQAKVSEEGKLTNVNSYDMLKKLVDKVKENPKEVVLKYLANEGKKSLIMRVGLTATIFAVVTLVGEVLGKEPLKVVAPGLDPAQAKNSPGFFSKAPVAAAIEDKRSAVELKA